MSVQNLVNGKNVTVKLASGGSGLVVLRRLSIRQLYAFVEFVTKDQTPELVAMCCGQELEWIDTLADESFALLAKMAIEENFPRAMAMSKEDQVIAVKIYPVLSKLVAIEKEVLKFKKDAGQIMSASLPEPAPVESAEAIGSASST